MIATEAAQDPGRGQTLRGRCPLAQQLLRGLQLTATQQQTLQQIDVRIADLPGAMLGRALGTTITLDHNAAGYGWFVDPTPWDNAEFFSEQG